MVVRIDPVQILMDIKCPKCGNFIIRDRDIARKVWARHSAKKSTLQRQLVDAKRNVLTLDCSGCSPPQKEDIVETFSYPAPTLEEVAAQIEEGK